MKKLVSLILLFSSLIGYSQKEDYYGPVSISFHGFICNRPTNDDPLGMDGVGDEIRAHFWNWAIEDINRTNYDNMAAKIYGEDFLIAERVKAGTATINGGIKAGDSYYREAVTGDNDPNTPTKYTIINTICSQNTLITILPTIWEYDKGSQNVPPLMNFWSATNNAFNDLSVRQKIQDFSNSYTYNVSNPYGFFLAGRQIGMDAKYTGLFIANKNKLASRPIGLFPNWDYSAQVIVLTPKIIKIIAERDYGYGKGILPVHLNEESMGNTEGHGNYILLLRFVADIKLRTTPQPQVKQYRAGIEVDSVAVGERFEFAIDGSNRVIVNQEKTTFYFPTKINAGQPFSISQISGPRNCDSIPRNLTMGDTDIIVKAKVILPPTNQKIGVKVNAVGEGERFEFSIGPNKKVIITEGNKVYYFPGTFTTGTSYTVSQLSGPRSCYLTSHVGKVAHADIIVDAGCGTVPQKTKLFGKFTAPPGTKIVLQCNNTDTLSLTQTATTGGGRLGTTDFSFRKIYAVDESYTVSIKSAPQGLGCKLYMNGEGQVQMPDGSNYVGVRCDYTHDLVSRSTDNKILNTYYESFTPVTGGMGDDEGRYIAFGAYGKGMDGSTGSYRQIFLRDRKNGTTKLISKTAAGAEANGNCHVPAISADGKSVAFESYATNLSGNDNNGARDIYLWQESTGMVTLISKSISGAAANSESMEPTISGDGSVIAFSSNAADISPLSKGGVNVFVHYVTAGTSELVSKDFETGKAAGGYVPSISDDGNKIAFCAYTNRLTQNDKNNLWDIFIWERSSPVLKRISMTATGSERNQGTESSSRVVAPSLSGDGKLVVFATTASNMVPGDMNEMQDIFICSTAGGNVRRMSRLGTGDSNGDSPISQGEKIGVSYDGKWITYNTNADNLGVLKGNIVIQNTQTGNIYPVTNISGGSTGRPMISRNGSYVVAGCSEKYDKRFASSGVFLFFPATNNINPVSKTK